MESLSVELNNLPDEILLIIFGKLDNLDILYSFHGVNKRLNVIIRDAIFTSSLNFVKWSSDKFCNKFSSNIILNRFCLQILPDISIKIQWFYLESSSAKSILRAADYPNLYGLRLYNLKKKTARRLFTDDSLSCSIFKKQITRLIITTNGHKNDLYTVVRMCSRIFSVFINLTHLMFGESPYKNTERLLFDGPSRSFSSSNLLVLNIKVQSFFQFIYLVDGRFSQLHTLIVDLVNIVFRPDLIDNKLKIPNLKCFVLSSAWEISCFDDLILPLLYRMSNLEKLGLYLGINRRGTFIDGNYLKKNILNCMPQLNVFEFDILSSVFINKQINFPSKEDIQRTFIDFQNTKIISYVDYFQEKNRNQCHVYSYPSEMQYYNNITNNFPGGLYQYVRLVSLYDEHPFEHEFFIRISQSFPFMQNLSVINHQSQKHKQSHESINHNHNSSIVKYNSLITLDIQYVHDDYIEEFLFNTKAYFYNDICLYINYKSLEKITHNFTSDSTRINCAKINEIYLRGEKTYSNSLRDYFS